MWEIAGLSIKSFVLGALGSLIALRFFDKLDVWQRWLTVLGGAVMATVGGDLVLQLLNLERRHDGIIAMLIGLFGMSVVSQVITTIKQIDWAEVRSWLPGRKG